MSQGLRVLVLQGTTDLADCILFFVVEASARAGIACPSRPFAVRHSDGLRRLPALDLQYNPLSTARRQPGILMHVHPVLRWNLKLQQPQLPR
jgi:hypothetical protein